MSLFSWDDVVLEEIAKIKPKFARERFREKEKETKKENEMVKIDLIQEKDEFWYQREPQHYT